MIYERRYFKRIHSMSVGRSLDDEIDDLLRRAITAYRRKWIARLVISSRFQARLMQRISLQRRPETHTTTVFTADQKDRLLAASTIQHVVLVDFPDMSRSPTKELWFVQEESKLAGRVDVTAPLRYQPSVDYASTAERFRQLGKLRIMASPEFSSIIRSLVGDVGVEEEVRGSLQDAIAIANRKDGEREG